MNYGFSLYGFILYGILYTKHYIRNTIYDIRYTKYRFTQRNLLLEYAKISGEDLEKLGDKGIFTKIKNAFG